MLPDVVAGSVPLTVPDPRRSPTCMGQPPAVWCASIWGKEKRRFLPFVRVIVVEVPDFAAVD